MGVKNNERRGVLLLLGTSLIWGSGFVAIKYSLSGMDPYRFMAVRFIIAAAAAVIIFRKRLKAIDRTAVIHGIIMGFMVSAALLFQVLGCAYTTVGKNAFLTSVYVAIIPFISWARTRKRPKAGCFIGAVICTAGAAVMSLGEVDGINIGDVLSLISGVLWAFDFEYTGVFSQKSHSADLLTVQLITSAVITSVLSLIMSPKIGGLPSAGIIGCVLYTALIANCLSYLMQFEGQKYVDSFTSGVIFALEAVFAGIFSYFIFGEIVTPKFAVGAFLIFISVFAPKFSFHTGKASAERQMLKRS